MVATIVGLRPKRSASDPNATPPRVPPSRNTPRNISPHRSRSASNSGPGPIRSASIGDRVMLNSCPSKASNTHPADATASTSHWYRVTSAYHGFGSFVPKAHPCLSEPEA